MREFIVLFGIIVLPALLSQVAVPTRVALDNLLFQAQTFAISIPQIALILLIIDLQPTARRNDFGVLPIRLIHLGGALLIGIALMVVSGLLVLLNQPQQVIEWTIHNRWSLLTIIPLSLAVGYREELYFRCYLLTRMRDMQVSQPVRIGIASLLFALGHLYQGVVAVIVAMAAGIILSIAFERHRNIHIIAIAHSLYNAVGIAFTAFA